MVKFSTCKQLLLKDLFLIIGITYFQNDSPSTQPFAAILPRPAELQSLASTPRQDSGNSHTVCKIISLAAYIAFNLRVAICNKGN